ncbi:MAG: LytTR family DNA-binding domain-containing protein [Bacteroidota bacterium]
MKLKAIIVDDEPHSIETLCFDLERCAKDKLEVVGTFDQIKTALQQIPRLQPDVLFTDIDMPYISGIEGVSMMPWSQVKVVFVTAHKKFAIDAIKVRAYDYLLKPIQLMELNQLVDKIHQESLEEFLETSRQENQTQRIGIPTSEGIELLDHSDILFVKAESNYSVFYLKGNRQITLGKTLKYFQEKLPVSFIRIHQSYLVNTQKIKKYLRRDGGALLLEEDHLLPISKSYLESVKAIIDRLS